MLSRAELIDKCDAYLAAVAAGDGPGTTALFAEDGTVEDPIGTPLRRGRAELLAFYSQPRAVRSVRRIGPVTVSGATAAFQFEISLTTSNPLPGLAPGSVVTLIITDLLTFDDEGRIVSMIGIPDGQAQADPGRE